MGDTSWPWSWADTVLPQRKHILVSAGPGSAKVLVVLSLQTAAWETLYPLSGVAKSPQLPVFVFFNSRILLYILPVY